MVFKHQTFDEILYKVIKQGFDGQEQIRGLHNGCVQLPHQTLQIIHQEYQDTLSQSSQRVSAS